MRQSTDKIIFLLREWGAIALTLLVLDLLWLGVLARGFYTQHVGHLMSPEANKLAALLFYVFYVTVIWATSVRGVQGRFEAWRRGATLGLICYGVYELTNWAVLKGWSPIVVPVDWAWGIFLTSTASAAGYLAGRQPQVESETHIV